MNTQNDNPHIVIVGGVAGGASAAARARRLNEHARITLIERGPDVSFANCGLPYHIGGEIEDRSKLALQTPETLKAQLAVDVLAETEVTSINRDAKAVTLRTVGSDESSELAYDKLILSPGASPLTPPLDGIDLPGIYTLRNLQDMDRIKTAAQEAKSALVIGAGFIGLEMAEQLKHIGKDVSLIELADQVLPQMDPEMVRIVEQELIDNGINLVLGDGINGFAQNGSSLQAKLNSGQTLEADIVILSIGVRPESGLAKDAGLELGARGHIKANRHMQTSDPDIYAVGDVSETVDPILGGPTAIALGGPANRQGRTAADHIFLGDQARPYPGSIGTSIVRVFDIAAGVTGFTEKRLQVMGIEYEKTIVTDYNHASYYPGATHLSVKVLWDKTTGRILGGQSNGIDGVDKRLDVLATAIKGKLTVEDLEHMELAYAPPFGSAKDPINTAGFSANNIRSGNYTPAYELPSNDSVQIVDVRPAEMAALKPIPNTRNIPYGQIRHRMDELDKSKPVITVCALGKTSYFASRILKQNGFNVSSHVGGWRIEAKPKPPASKTAFTSHTHTADSSINTTETIVKLDATGLACPGPILRVKEAAAELKPGEILEVRSSDAGFKNDLPPFCKANGYEFISAEKEKGIVTGRLRLSGTPAALTGVATPVATPSANGSTLVVFSGEMDKVMAAFVIANGAIAMGGKATLFFTFWGLNALRKDSPPEIKDKTFMDKMFGWMLPRGVNKLPLSNMHMAGMGTKMMKDRMADKKLPNLPDLMQTAIDNGARLVACGMSMEAMGIREEELIDGVEIGGVAEFLGAASETNTNLFV
ncbi:FAD-dependent oxidoreductase [Coraliomargarita akajimensis]|uniref:FAD-dependent pyridine nucleotide-disulfide oxidoreductase n=1 Tax=Coraliomargarita akajimensis (strain DSM 45221 / IAM 15411 / JCM 23193 / KCTC 12865 / 04OKA010-24) TaxID=583355 RepID=D5EMU0_CORAD|nr:FAD-dependent oxidoreductase [Coraliomargarita akajimensis]ADE55330.1 FAD-dependent pyridine nucleotide-disulfide oxidoreductase [Coraliomargarita akajimensis DSM 45221]